jgi:hypothetical protein
MASKRKPFSFYDTFNDTFDSSVQALKNLSSFPTFSTSVPVAAEIEPDQHEGLDRRSNSTLFAMRMCVTTPWSSISNFFSAFIHSNSFSAKGLKNPRGQLMT